MKEVWQGTLETQGRCQEPITCRLVEAPGAFLDPMFRRGEGFRLEKQVNDGYGERWEATSANLVSPVSLAVALAEAMRPRGVVSAREVPVAVQPGPGAQADCG